MLSSYGGSCLIIYKLGMLILPMNAIWTLLAIIIGVGVYGVVLIFTKTITEEELYAMPKGTMLIGLLKKVRLL